MRTSVLPAAAVLALVAGTSMAQVISSRPQPRDNQPEVRPENRPTTVIGRGAQARHELVPVDWILGSRVLGDDRERLGEVSDLIIDPQRGRVLYGLLDHGGMLGMGERHVAVPWKAFNWDHMNRVLTLPASTDRLSNAPHLDRDDWQRLSDQEFRGRFDEFFGGGANGDGQIEARFAEQVRRSPDLKVRGTIRGLDLVEPVSGMGMYRVLRIATDNGQEQSVVVGPQWFVDRQRRVFQEGQQVQVEAARLDMEGPRELMVAKSINTPRGAVKLRDGEGRGVWDLAADFKDERREQEPRDRDRERRDADREDHRGRGITDAHRPGADRAERITIVRARDLRGQRITDDQNNEIGRVDTFLINPDNGRLGYAVITVGGFLGVGDEKYAVPWRAFNVNQQGKLVAKIDKEQLRNAPKIETRNWSELQDPEFGRRVYQHFGAPMDWDRDEDADAGRVDRDHGRKDVRRDDNRLGQWDEDTFVRLFSDGAAADVSGSVVRIDPVGQGGVADLVVRTDGGERLVKLLPKDMVDKNILNLDEGDRVTVRGKQASIDGRRVIIARDVQAEGRTYQLRDEFGRPEVRVRR